MNAIRASSEPEGNKNVLIALDTIGEDITLTVGVDGVSRVTCWLAVDELCQLIRRTKTVLQRYAGLE